MTRNGENLLFSSNQMTLVNFACLLALICETHTEGTLNSVQQQILGRLFRLSPAALCSTGGFRFHSIYSLCFPKVTFNFVAKVGVSLAPV